MGLVQAVLLTLSGLYIDEPKPEPAKEEEEEEWDAGVERGRHLDVCPWWYPGDILRPTGNW